MLFCFDSETSPIVRQKPLPRTLSPLKRKPDHENHLESSTQSHEKRRSRNSPFMHTWNKTVQQPLASPAQRKSPHLTIPLSSGVSIQSLSSSSSGSSSPLPDLLPSPAGLSAHSKSSISSSEQSPLVVKKSTESSFHLVSPTPLHKSTSLPQLEHKSAKQSLPPAHTPKLPRTLVRPSHAHASPYLMPVTRLKPLERPVRNPSGKNSLLTKKKHQRQQSITKVQNEHLSPESVGQSGKHNTTVDQPVWSSTISNIAVENPTATLTDGNLQMVDTNNCSPHFHTAEPPVKSSQSNPGLSIPTITIRSATPVKTPSEEESLVSLCKQFVFRAELVQELDNLKDELKSIAEANNSLVNSA